MLDSCEDFLQGKRNWSSVICILTFSGKQNMDMLAGTPAAILDHEVTMRMESIPLTAEAEIKMEAESQIAWGTIPSLDHQP